MDEATPGPRSCPQTECVDTRSEYVQALQAAFIELGEADAELLALQDQLATLEGTAVAASSTLAEPHEAEALEDQLTQEMETLELLLDGASCFDGNAPLGHFLVPPPGIDGDLVHIQLPNLTLGKLELAALSVDDWDDATELLTVVDKARDTLQAHRETL